MLQRISILALGLLAFYLLPQAVSFVGADLGEEGMDTLVTIMRGFLGILVLWYILEPLSRFVRPEAY